jgi:hypothetical protein
VVTWLPVPAGLPVVAWLPMPGCRVSAGTGPPVVARTLTGELNIASWTGFAVCAVVGGWPEIADPAVTADLAPADGPPTGPLDAVRAPIPADADGAAVLVPTALFAGPPARGPAPAGPLLA